MKVELSIKEFYKGGVLFEDLNDFLVKNGFEMTAPQKTPIHCDVIYVKK